MKKFNVQSIQIEKNEMGGGTPNRFSSFCINGVICLAIKDLTAYKIERKLTG